MDQAFQGDAMTAAGIVGLVLTVLLIMMVISLLPTIFYLLTLQKAFFRCESNNHAMQPGLVWLMLIPFFNIIWHFFVVINLSDSLEKEFTEQGLQSEPAPGKSLGMAMCILNVCSIIPTLACSPVWPDLFAGLSTGLKWPTTRPGFPTQPCVPRTGFHRQGDRETMFFKS